MFSLMEKDPDIWRFFEEGKFSVNKSNIPFFAIGPDHGIEQENRALKVSGGIKGIANSEDVPNEYFVTAGEIGNMVEKFCETFHVAENQLRKRDKHHELYGSKKARIENNTAKVQENFEVHNVNFEKTTSVFNILTKKVMPAGASERFSKIKDIGEEKYRNFIAEILESNKSIWDTISKEKIETFSSNNKSVNVEVNNLFVQIKEERKLMISRPDIHLSTYLGEYEFTVVPGSLFASDGTLHQTTEKSVISTELRKVLPEKYEEDHHVSSKRVIVFDGMALVNKIDIKKSKIKTCLEFSDHFIKVVKRESTCFNEVRVVIDRYDETSLKIIQDQSGTRERLFIIKYMTQHKLST